MVAAMTHEIADDDQRADTRSRLLEATYRLILEKGIASVRVDEVLAEVGVTKGSLYWHFENRQDLIRQALTEQLQQLVGPTIETMADAVDSATDDKDAYLAALGSVFVNPFDPDEVERRWQRIELLAASRHDPEFATIMAEVQAVLLRSHLAIIEQSAEKGLLRGGLDPRALAVALMAVALGSNVISMLGDEAPSPEAWFGLLMFLVAQMYPEADGS